jgi:hypothetical protein
MLLFSRTTKNCGKGSSPRLEIVERPRHWDWYPVDVELLPMAAFTVLPRLRVLAIPYRGAAT